MWEFQRLKITGQPPDQVFDTLNELGKEGWSIIQYEEKDVHFDPQDSIYIIVLAKKLDSSTPND
jgi:hypothetical protein